MEDNVLVIDSKHAQKYGLLISDNKLSKFSKRETMHDMEALAHQVEDEPDEDESDICFP